MGNGEDNEVEFYGALDGVRQYMMHLPGGSDGKEPACQCRRRDTGSILGSGRCPGGENGNPLQYPCLGDPTDRSPVGYSAWATEESATKQVSD